MTASMQIDQVGLPAGVPNFSREDGLDTGALVTLTSLSHQNTFKFSLLWVGQHPAPDVGSIPSLTQAGPSSYTFSPDAGVYGSWRIELITDEGTAQQDRQVRTFAVKNGLRIPAPNEFSDPGADLMSAAGVADFNAFVQRNESNIGDGITNSPFELASWSAWWRPVADLINSVNTGGTGAPITSTPPVDVTKAAAAVGLSIEAARSDHKHDIATDTPDELNDSVNFEGFSTSLARADHVHSHGSRGGGSLHALVVAGGAAGFMSGADKTALDAAATLGASAPVNVVKNTALAGVSTDAARSDHRHDIDVAIPTGQIVGGTNSEGLSTSLARADHVHSHPRGLPVNVGTANAAGSGTAFAGADHVHDHGAQTTPTHHATAIASGNAGFMSGADKQKLDDSGVLTSTAPANVTKAAAAVGVSVETARADHKHDITTAAAIKLATANAEGVATTLARSDHNHEPRTEALLQTITTALAVDATTTNILPTWATLLTQAITVAANSRLRITADMVASNTNNGRHTYMRITVDGTQIGRFSGIFTDQEPFGTQVLDVVSGALASGSRTVELQWCTEANTARCRAGTAAVAGQPSELARLVIQELGA